MPVTVRIPKSTLRFVEAIQSRRHHQFRGDTLREAIEQYVQRELSEAA